MNSTLSKKDIIYYSLIALPLAIIGMPLYIYLPTFYTSNVGIEVATVGVIIFLARLTDVFTDPFFGYLSDKSVQKFNSRKPIMILGGLLLIFSFYFLINPNLEYAKTWLLFFSILIYIAWSMINIPYLTWSAEISTKYEDKTVLNSSRELFTILGVITALIIPYFLNVSQNPQKTLDVLYYSFLFIFIPFFLISLKKVVIKTKSSTTKFSIKELTNIYKNRPDLKSLQISYFLNNLANALPATLFLLFTEHVIQEKSSSGMILILYFFSAVIALPFWNFFANKIGKKSAWIYSIIIASSAFIFTIFLEAKDLNAFIIISIITGLCLGADMALPTSIQSDVVQKNSKQSNISGILFGIWTMITKFSLALAIALSFIILGIFDFETSNPSTQSLTVLTLLYSIAPVILKIIAIFFILKYSDKKS